MTEGRSARGLSLATARRGTAWALTRRRAWAVEVSLVVVVAVLARLPWLLLVHLDPSWDSLIYMGSAKLITEGHGYVISGHPTAFFPVGWPAFLAGYFLIAGSSFAAVKALNVVLWSITVVLVCALGRRLGGKTVGLVAGLLVAVAPTLVILPLQAFSEGLFIPLLLTVCLLLSSRRETLPLRVVALAGAILGLAVLVRSTATLVPVVLSLWLLFRRPRRESWRAALVLVASSCLVVSPWLVRNEIVMHTFALSTNGGCTLWIGNHPHATGNFGGGRWNLDSVASEVKQDRVLTEDSISFAVHHRSEWIALIPHKFKYLMHWSSWPLRIRRAVTAIRPDRGSYSPPGATNGFSGRGISSIGRWAELLCSPHRGDGGRRPF